MIHFSELGRIVKAQSIQVKDELPVSKLHYDSRKITLENGSVFFALKGNRIDGHQFLEEAHLAGVRQFVIQEGENISPLVSNCNVVVVDDTLKALHQLVSFQRSQFSLPILGITGSNGKTIVKEWVSTLLSIKYNVVNNPGSYNSQLGVPISLWNIKSNHDFGVFEAGISLPGEMENLHTLIKPTFGIFTTLGSAHDEGFTSVTEKLKEKLKLFKDTEKIIYRKDQSNVDDCMKEQFPSSHLISWSTKTEDSSYYVRWIEDKTSEIIIHNHPFKVSFQDIASLENITHCIVFLMELGFNQEEIQNGLNSIKPVGQRLSLVQGINQSVIIEDFYNNDLAGLEMAVDFTNRYNRNLSKAIITSDIPQLNPQNREETYLKLSELLNKNDFKKLIGIGNEIKLAKDHFKGEAQFYDSTDSFLNSINLTDLSKQAILLKGGRAFEFEKISEILEEKIHHTTLYTNLGAVTRNLNYYRNKISTGTKIMAMVKALAYGSGALEIAQHLEFNRVDYLGVAYSDEARNLRENGITIPIMVMNIHPDDFDIIVRYNLEPEIYSHSLLVRISEYVNYTEQKIKIHLKIDTGMNRLGFNPDSIPDVLNIISENEYLEIAGVFTHLAASEDPDEDDFTRNQVSVFKNACDIIADSIEKPFIRHVLNSEGISRFPEYQFEMVRLGIGLYGISANSKIKKELTCANTLKTIISQIKELKPGDTVGYGRAGKINHKSKIATLAIGYADGYKRSLGNGKGYFLVEGHKAPTIGNVCMDMVMADITGIDAREGDEVEVFGPNLPVYELSKASNTIVYEVLSGISSRVKRVYLNE